VTSPTSIGHGCASSTWCERAKSDVDEGAFCNAIEFEWCIGLGTGV
jgi:hypothetical protein